MAEGSIKRIEICVKDSGASVEVYRKTDKKPTEIYEPEYNKKEEFLFSTIGEAKAKVEALLEGM